MKLQVGDVLFVHDKRWWNLVATGVVVCETDRLKNKRHIPYHVAIVSEVRLDLEDVEIVESVWGKGVTRNKLSKYMKPHFNIWFKRHLPPLDELQQMRLWNWLGNEVGSKYDKMQIVGIFFRSFLRVLPPLYRWMKKRKHLWTDSRFRFICSELVKLSYLVSICIDLCVRTSGSNVTPYDLDRSKLLKRVEGGMKSG